MRHSLLIILFFVAFNLPTVLTAKDLGVKLLWKEGEVKGQIEVQNTEFPSMFVCETGQKRDNRAVSKNTFHIAKADRQFLALYFSQIRTVPGPEPALVIVRTKQHAFSFFLRDVTSANPIYIPSYGVAVVPVADLRNYRQVEEDILSRGLLTKIARSNLQPETTFEQVAPYTRNMSVPIWLGLGRDMRLFEITEELQDQMNVSGKVIVPTKSSRSFNIPEFGDRNLSYRYALGRGVGPLNNIRRWLDDEMLPIYHSEMRDDDVIYHSISFASLENELTEKNIVGTDFLISDSYSTGRIFTPDQEKQLEEKLLAKNHPEQEVVLYCRTLIVNTGQVPRYAWFILPSPFGVKSVGFHG